MNYQRFKPTGVTNRGNVAVVATVAGVPHPYTALARDTPTAKFNNNNNNIYIKVLCHSEPVSLSEKVAAAPAPISAWVPIPPATAATIATLPAYQAALAKFKEHRPYGFTRFRHNQAAWAAEMFLNQWGLLAAEFGWSVDDIFGPHGLAWWLGVELVTALGPEHAVSETRRVYGRMTRTDWLNPYMVHGNA